jgi:hypothetical protein
MIPARLTPRLRPQPRRVHPELARDPAGHLLGHAAGILQEPTRYRTVPSCSAPGPVALAPAPGDQLAVALITEEELGQLIGREPLRKAAVILPRTAPAITRGPARWRSPSDGRL